MISRASFAVVFGLVALAPVLARDGAQSLDPSAWLLGANHLHSSPGGERSWASGIKHIASFSAREGIAFACVSDHNTIEGWFLPEFTENRDTVLVPGEEWTSRGGHANLVNYRADSVRDVILPPEPGDDSMCPSESRDEAGNETRAPPTIPIDHAAMVREVHSRGGLVIINHPALRFYPWPANTFGADACEVGPSLTDRTGKKALEWWLARLESGSRITAVAGSDYHFMRPKQDAARGPVFTPSIDTPINLMLAPGRDVEGFRQAILSRRVEVLKNRKAPRILAAARAGRQEDTIGGAFVGPAGSRLQITYRILGGKGLALTLLDSRVEAAAPDRRIESRAITSGDARITVERSLTGTTRGFVIAWVGDLVTLTNPIWY